MLPKTNRLTGNKDFNKVFKKGKGQEKDFLFLKSFKNNLQTSRFGIVVSQKVSKKAAERNKIKRQISEILREEAPKIKKGVDVILLVKPNIKKRNFAEIKEKLKEALNVANLARE